MEEIQSAGGGLRKFYSSIDAFLVRTVAYTTARTWGFTYFYDKVNKDPRRLARPDYMVLAGVLGGFVAGVATNPIDIVFNRMQVDELYPEAARRNYAHLLDGLYKVMEEGALMRGSMANGLKLATICSSMTSIYDLCKENSYYFFGPHWINRFWATAVAVTMGTAVSMPFDMIRTRLHTMRALPNGEMPYSGFVDCFTKIAKYECNTKYGSNFQSFYAGLEAYWIRLFLICWLSQYMLDVYHANNFDKELWQAARFHYQTGIDYDIHDPYTDAFNKSLVASYTGVGGFNAAHPNGKDGMIII